ncbi:MAG: biotin--[acetyl-CoA-carboxylase] ligase [Prevotella sp.]|nr:biotin--[acetyl-CoA-carboxylase] ligase [Prevotella sp.]
MDFRVVHIDETDSTNHWLWENGVGDMVVVADYQTTGRGCGTNTWESARGKNLLFSVLLHPQDIPANRQFLVSEAVSVALCEALEQYAAPMEIKWPNDIYYGEKKLCGILIEHRLQGNVIKDSVVGIGINVNQEVFVSDAPNPVSLRQIVGHEIDRERLLHAFLQILPEALQRERLAADYRQRLFRREGLHRYEDAVGGFEATIDDVLEDGRLQLVDADGHQRIYAFKEVKFIIESQ